MHVWLNISFSEYTERRGERKKGGGQGRSYVISYVARKPPFSRGRRGLSTFACARRHTPRRLHTSPPIVYNYSRLCNANVVSLWGSGTTSAHAYNSYGLYTRSIPWDIK